MFVAACRGQGSGPAAATSSATPLGSPESPATTAPSSDATPAIARTWAFDGDTAGTPPAGWAFGRAGEGRPGRWLVRAEPGAPSGANVLAQLDADPTDDRFPVAWVDEPTASDVDLSVRCKPVSGRVDQACGLVFRLRDASNYYLTRANALENNVRFYFVKAGRRQQLASWSGAVSTGAWHAYRVTMQGDHVQVFWDGAKVIDARDATFVEAGKVGVWTKADSVTYFDDLVVKPM